MPEEEIIIEISPEGEVVVKTKGFKGKACTDASKIFEKAFGGEAKTKMTQEYFLKEKHQVQIKQEQK